MSQPDTEPSHTGPVRLANRLLIALALGAASVLLIQSVLNNDFVHGVLGMALLMVTLNSVKRWNDSEFSAPSGKELAVSRWVFGIAAALILASLLHAFISSDRCLDQGGRWNAASKICEK